MWRPLVRRAAAMGLCPAISRHHNERATSPLTFIELASRFSLLSRPSQVHLNPRFCSTSYLNHEDSPSKPSIDNIFGVLDFGAPDALDEMSEVKFGDGGSIFEDAVGNFEMGKGFSENLKTAIAIDGNLDAEDEKSGQLQHDDPDKLENLLSFLQSSATVDESFESHVEKMSLALDQEFVLKVLQTQSVPEENVIAFFKWVLKKSEFKLSSVVFDALVNAVVIENKKKVVYELWDLVKAIGKKEKGIITTESLNLLLAGFSKLGKGKAAYDLFQMFEDFGCPLNADAFYLTLEALCKRSFYNWACIVCQVMLEQDKLPDSERVGKIITFLCKGGMVKQAHLLYLHAKDKKVLVPQASIDYLTISLSRIMKADKRPGEETDAERDRETVLLAVDMLGDYSGEKRKRAIKPFTSVIKKLCWIRDVGLAKALLLEMVDSGPPPGNAVFNCVINGLAKIEDVNGALSFMRLMDKRGLKPDLYTYTVVLSGYARSGEMERACEIFDEAKRNHSKLSPVVYHSLIRGFCKLDRFDEAVSLLREMRSYGVRANHDEYNKLIKSLCFKALDWETAERLEEEMRLNGVVLNGRTRALIGAVKELKEGASVEEERVPA